MAVSIERGHPGDPRPAGPEERIRFCAACGERVFIIRAGFWAHPHTFVAKTNEKTSGQGSFCAACGIFRGSAAHLVEGKQT